MHIQFQLCHLKLHFILNFKFQVKKFKCHIFFSVLHVLHFFVWLECPTSFVAQTSCHYQMVGSTGSRETQRSCQVNRWGGHWKGMSHWVFPVSKNRMWLMQFSQGVVQCQKTSGRRFGTYKHRTIPSQPSVARVDYSSMDHSKMEDGISLCVLWMWYQLQRTQRDSWTRNWIRTSFLW